MAAKKSSNLYIGVDVGGTKILAGVADDCGRVYARLRRETPRKGGADVTAAAVMDAMDAALEKGGFKRNTLNGIGLAIAGQVDTGKGLVVNTPNMNLTGLKLGPMVAKEFGAPCFLGNDVRLGILGEAWLGAAREAASAVGIFVGTGIGGGVILDGMLVMGARGIAGEIGHIIMQPGGPLCGCGNRGCFEALASRTAIQRRIREGLAAGRSSVVADLLEGEDAVIKGKTLNAALRSADELVVEVMRGASETLGLACLSVRHLLDPDVIVLGGGVIEACGWFVVPIVEEIVAKDPLPGVRPGGRVVEAALGDNATMLGAVALAQGFGRDRPVEPAEPLAPEYPEIDRVDWGVIEIGGEVYENDVYIRGDGAVKKRRKSRVKEAYGTSHKVGAAELEKVCRGAPELVVIGTGHDGLVSLEPDGRQYLEYKGIKYRLEKSAEAAGLFNRAKGRKAALIHVTC